MSPNFLVEHQTLVFSTQIALVIEQSLFELSKPSFGSDSPTFLIRTQVNVMDEPKVSFVTRYFAALLHLWIRISEPSFGV